MADSTIPNLTAGTVAAADDFVFSQSGTTKTDTIQGILDLVPSSSNLGSANLIADANRTYTLNGALITDTLIFDNSSSHNLLELNGDSTYQLGGGSAGSAGYFSLVADGRMFMYKSASNFIEINATTGANRFYFLNNGLNLQIGSKDFIIDSTSTDMHFFQGTFQIGDTLQATSSATNSVLVENGTAPSANKTNRHWYYSDDITAGEAAPHFRTETGDILKLYKNTALTASDGTLANAVIRQGEIETILTNLGII